MLLVIILKMNGAALLIISKCNDEPRSVGETMMLLFFVSVRLLRLLRARARYIFLLDLLRKDTLSPLIIKKKERRRRRIKRAFVTLSNDEEYEEAQNASSGVGVIPGADAVPARFQKFRRARAGRRSIRLHLRRRR